MSRLAIVAMVTLAQVHHLLAAVAVGLDQRAAASLAILHGHPHLPAFQSRLLTPALQQLLVIAGVPSNYAFAGLYAGFLVAFNALFAAVSRTVEPRAWLPCYLLTSLGWFAFFDAANIFLWDGVDIIVFLLLAFTQAGRLSGRWLFPLYVIALANRESAAFIGLWIVISALAGPAVNWRRAAVGGLAVAAAILYADGLRHWLLVASDVAVGDVAGGSTLTWRDNLAAIGALSRWPMRLPLALLLAGLAGWLLARSVRPGRGQLLAIYLLLVLVLSTTFGLWTEPRIYLALVPLLAQLAVPLEDPALSAAAGVPPQMVVRSGAAAVRRTRHA